MDRIQLNLPRMLQSGGLHKHQYAVMCVLQLDASVPNLQDCFYSGFCTTIKYMGVKMPLSPPCTRPSAPLHSIVCVAVEPLGAKPTSSMPRSDTCVHQRPTGVVLKSARVQWPCSDEYHGTSVSCSARSVASTNSKPTLFSASFTSSFVLMSGKLSPSYNTHNHYLEVTCCQTLHNTVIPKQQLAM